MRQQCAWQQESECSHQAGGLGWAKVVMGLEDLRSRSPANTANDVGTARSNLSTNTDIEAVLTSKFRG